MGWGGLARTSRAGSPGRGRNVDTQEERTDGGPSSVGWILSAEVCTQQGNSGYGVCSPGVCSPGVCLDSSQGASGHSHPGTNVPLL